MKTKLFLAAALAVATGAFAQQATRPEANRYESLARLYSLAHVEPRYQSPQDAEALKKAQEAVEKKMSEAIVRLEKSLKGAQADRANAKDDEERAALDERIKAIKESIETVKQEKARAIESIKAGQVTRSQALARNRQLQSEIQQQMRDAERSMARAQRDMQDAFKIRVEMMGKPDVKVDAEINNLTLREAIKKLCDQAKVEFTIDKDVPEGGNKVSLGMKGVNLGTALDILTETAGIGWHREINVENGKQAVKYRFGKSIRSARGFAMVLPDFAVGKEGVNLTVPDVARNRSGLRVVPPNFENFRVQVDPNAFSPLEGFKFNSDIALNGTIQNWVVNGRDNSAKLDVQIGEMGVRDAIKKICDQAKVDYSIDEDVPKDGAIVSLTAKNIRLHSALDILSDAAGIGYMKVVKDENGKTTTLYKFAKKYKGRAGSTLLGSVNSGLGALDAGVAPLPNPLAGGGASITRDRPLVYRETTSETRRTYDCPSGKGKVTVVSKPGQTLKFCPLCGKPINLEKRNEKEPDIN